MECGQSSLLTDIEYLQQFRRKTIRNRVPLSGSMDLTDRCNFKCVHCYVGDRTARGFQDRVELDTGQWQRIIDEVVAEGCLYLLFSGGDPLLRSDFCEIYTYARKRGLIITIFTNGTTLTDEIITTFAQYPPRMVEITIYGATGETYEKVTGRENGLAKCLGNVHKMQKHGINIGLKTILMTLNLHEFHQMEEIARDLDVSFRYDAAIFPRFDGDKSVTGLRVAPEKVAEIDFADPDRVLEWASFYERMKDFPANDHLYSCGSGVTNFHITPDGKLQPCLMCRTVTHDLLKGSFTKGWRETLPAIHALKSDPDSKCTGCEQKNLCDFCPPFAELENGSHECGPEYLCRLGNSRYQQLTNIADKNEKQEITA